MKRKLFVFGLLVLLLGLSASLAMACNCGKKVDGKQASSCQSQCAGGCGGQSACSEGSFQLAQAKMIQQEGQEDELKAVEVGNKICPVSGDKIPAPGEKSAMGEVVKYEYNGKIYNLCCEMCVKDFKKNPEKYSKIAEEEVKGKGEMSDKEKMGHDHKGSHENHPGHDHSK